MYLDSWRSEGEPKILRLSHFLIYEVYTETQTQSVYYRWNYALNYTCIQLSIFHFSLQLTVVWSVTEPCYYSATSPATWWISHTLTYHALYTPRCMSSSDIHGRYLPSSRNLPGQFLWIFFWILLGTISRHLVEISYTNLPRALYDTVYQFFRYTWEISTIFKKPTGSVSMNFFLNITGNHLPPPGGDLLH